MDSHRLHAIHADPASATPDEIKSLASDAHEFLRTRGQLDLRDHFAIAGIPFARAEQARYGEFGTADDENGIARRAYRFADAMLRARS